MNLPAVKNLTTEELGKVLEAITSLKAWIAVVEDYSLQLAVSGEEIPGWTLSTTRTSRIWLDESMVRLVLASKGFTQDQYAPRVLLSVAQAEKLIGKKQFTGSELFDLVGSTEGKPKLIPASDIEAN